MKLFKLHHMMQIVVLVSILPTVLVASTTEMIRYQEGFDLVTCEKDKIDFISILFILCVF